MVAGFVTKPNPRPARRSDRSSRLWLSKSGEAVLSGAAAPTAPIAGADDDWIEVRLRLPRRIVEHSIADAPTPVAQSDRVALAAHILRGRRRRQSIFADVRFGEPSWDMILDLYVSTRRGERIDVSNLCLASGVAMTTAFRHVGMMVRRGYLTREGDVHDKRRTFVVMSPRLKEAVDRWLDLQAAALALKA